MSYQAAMSLLDIIAQLPGAGDELAGIDSFEALAAWATGHDLNCDAEELERVFRNVCSLRHAHWMQLVEDLDVQRGQDD